MPPSRLKKKKAQEKVIPWKLLIYLVTLLLAAGLWIWIASDHSLEGTSFLRDNSKQPSPFDMFEVTGDRKADDETEHESEDKSSSPHFDLHQLLQSRTSHGLNETIEVFEDVSKMLREHPLKGVYRSIARDSRVEDVLYSLQQTKQCFGHPIIISMARVGSQLYWQLIENYIYTLVKFEMVHCAIMVCVNDVECMRMCADADFPCYNFEYKHLELSNNLNNLKGESTEISSMEQIAHLKLLHLPKALKRGVDIFVLDLDVGFTASPKELLEKFKKSDKDVMVQKDITFIMHRSKELWKTWFTEAMPNIGIMACKGNEKTFKMFQYAWNEYLTTDTSIRKNPGKDQNKVAGALSYAKKTYNLKWNYFPDSSTMLLDKVFKFDDNRIELGGAMSEKILKKKSTVAAHTTCYEQNAKMKGLKVPYSNHLWISKLLMY